MRRKKKHIHRQPMLKLLPLNLQTFSTSAVNKKLGLSGFKETLNLMSSLKDITQMHRDTPAPVDLCAFLNKPQGPG